jgi:hypothetical protein
MNLDPWRYSGLRTEVGLTPEQGKAKTQLTLRRCVSTQWTLKSETFDQFTIVE